VSQQLARSEVVNNIAVASSATVVTLIAARKRMGLSIFNDSTAILHVKLGTAASATDKTLEIAAGGYWDVPYNYQGIVTGIWDSANGFAYVAEYT
jgi:hypothetical protein